MKTKFNLFLLGIILIAGLLSSCRARFYTPNRNPVPLFQSAGEVYLDASSNLMNKVDLTAGLAVTNQIAGYVGYAGAFTDNSGTNNFNDIRWWKT